ncbi:MAG: hypothetical protein JXQ90_02900 [Cyclobacteriaceae bacterium]
MKAVHNPSDILKSHFDRLKEIVPEIYQHEIDTSSKEEQLFSLLKRSLGVIEAVYFQNKEMFTPARVDEYSKLIAEMKSLGFSYVANKELMEKAAAAAIMTQKLPMAKAGDATRSKGADGAKKAM